MNEGLNPFDYSECYIGVYFELADKDVALQLFESLDFVRDIKEQHCGYVLTICYQHIPEVVKQLAERNIALYSVIPNK